MTTSVTLALAALVLGIGTFACRCAGSVLRTRIELSPRAERLMGVSTVVLLASLVATAALIDDHEFVGFARPAGVVVAGVLAWRKVPFIVVVLAAAATAAGLRLLGVD
jgi:branched-subunit amino acid transport protein